ncbi:DUF1311 domain-containing protein [Bosea psychrotolerans]|uniref:Lysozyme inhibitor LprI N-terminal domain-containing protein n=1 Tax=Bosea psychrotolerans TaxID=1871628 RepID=A0A2S4MHX6_9HYPH|nr:DUF1311 domain-containing protein [Bosea psychrotolerans]POR54219.1 hypothetical protein CYD53_103322 [Bosea psychrotolerans]
MIPLNAFPLFLLMVSATPLWAQAPSPPPGRTVLASDRAQLAACLREGRIAAPSCIGMIAVACVRATGVDQRAAETGCARREEAVWRERMLLALRLKGRTLDAGQRNRVVALQVAWESFVAQKCAFYGTTQREGWQLGRQAGCELREVANRAIELEASLPQAQPRQPQAPPRIIR